jgi:hypothetical protein
VDGPSPISICLELRQLCDAYPVAARSAGAHLDVRLRRLATKARCVEQRQSVQDAASIELARELTVSGDGNAPSDFVLDPDDPPPRFEVVGTGIDASKPAPKWVAGLYRRLGRMNHNIMRRYLTWRDGWMAVAVEDGIDLRATTGLDALRELHQRRHGREWRDYQRLRDPSSFDSHMVTPGYCLWSLARDRLALWNATPVPSSRQAWALVMLGRLLIDPDLDPASLGVKGLPAWNGPAKEWFGQRQAIFDRVEIHGLTNKDAARKRKLECLVEAARIAASAPPAKLVGNAAPVTIGWQKMQLALEAVSAEIRRGGAGCVPRIAALVETAQSIFPEPIEHHLPAGASDVNGLHKSARRLATVLAGLRRDCRNGAVADGRPAQLEELCDWIEGTFPSVYGDKWVKVSPVLPRPADHDATEGQERAAAIDPMKASSPSKEIEKAALVFRRPVPVAEAAVVMGKRGSSVIRKLKSSRRPVDEAQKPAVAEFDDICQCFGRFKKRLTKWADEHFPAND